MIVKMVHLKFNVGDDGGIVFIVQKYKILKRECEALRLKTRVIIVLESSFFRKHVS